MRRTSRLGFLILFVMTWALAGGESQPGELGSARMLLSRPPAQMSVRFEVGTAGRPNPNSGELSGSAGEFHISAGRQWLFGLGCALLLAVTLASLMFMLQVRRRNSEISRKNDDLEREITKRLEVERALSDSGRLLTGVFSSINDGILVIRSQDGAVLDCNRSAAAILRVSRESLIEGLESLDLQEQFRVAILDPRLGPVSDQGDADLDSEREVRRPDGTTFLASITATPLRQMAPEKICWVLSIRDMTKRKKAEEDLRKTAVQLESIFRVAPVGLGVVIDRKLGWMNKRVCEMLAEDEALIRERGAASLLRDQTVNEGSYPGSSSAIRTMETVWKRADGKAIEVLLTTTPVDLDSPEAGLTFCALDITERKRLEGQLLQSQKMEALGRLAGGVAHDFNNLLTGIFGYTEIALNNLPESFPARSPISEVRQLARRAAGLTRQLLAFSRKQSIARAVVNLNDLVRDTMEMLRRTIGEDIDLKFIPDPEAGNVCADSGQIEQVLLNLAVNARDAMPAGGHLTIETGRRRLEAGSIGHQEIPAGDHSTLTVTDTGFGMDRTTVERIFEPFFTTKPPDSGTGLGLSTVHGIIKQHDGHILAYSEIGQGTTFRILLPRASEESEPRATPDRDAQEEPRGDETVLLVEDDEALRILVRCILLRQGYRVLVAGSPEEAEDIFRRHESEISLMVTDIVMPRRTGPELYERLEEIRPGLKVLYMSGYSDRSILETKVLRRGMPFLQKPFRPIELGQKIRNVLAEPGSRVGVVVPKWNVEPHEPGGSGFPQEASDHDHCLE